MASSALNIRRLVMDVDKAVRGPSVIEIAAAIQTCRGVEACNITVSEIDLETVGTDVAIEGQNLDYDEIVRAIESSGAVVHSLDQVIAGDRLILLGPRVR